MGGLLREARLYNRLSILGCGQVLGIEPDSYKLIEDGEAALSLPDLEVLAMYFGVSMAYFWEDKELTKENQKNFTGYLTLRQAIIGTTLRQFRKEKGTSIEELAEITELTSEQISAFESGEVVPYFELGRILKGLGRSVKDLSDDDHGPLAQHEDRLVFKQGFENLPPELKRFVIQPINQGYLETAMRLSRLDGETLRKIAEGILEITY